MIPVHPTNSLLKLNDTGNPLVMLVFAWNFFDNIAKKVAGVLKGLSHKEVTFLVTFPEPRLIHVDLTAPETSHQLLQKLPHYSTHIPDLTITYENRTKTTMLTHQLNKEFLIPLFIVHHAPMFDRVNLIDFESDDGTLEIIKIFAPPSWEVVNSKTGKVFSALETDQKVIEHEKMYPEDWQVVLNTTEFLLAPNLQQVLWTIYSNTIGNETEQSAKSFVAAIQIMRVDGNNIAPVSYSMPLPEQRF